MKEKVYINRVNVDYQSLYARAKDYFHRHGIEISFTFEQSDIKNLTYVIRQFPQGQRIILQPTMANVVSIDNSYDFTSFVFNGREFPPPNIPTSYCYVPAHQPFIDLLTDELNPKDLDYVTICHEHMHALTFLANQRGFPTADLMDDYYKNMQLEDSDSNFGRQWLLLTPFVASLKVATPTLPQVTITRQSSDLKQTLGILTANNNGATFTCKTLELPWLNNQHDISCIPKGTYQVKYTFSWRLLKNTYEIQNVQNRSGIRIHIANYYSDLLGCIALGNGFADINGDKELDVINSTATINAFEKFMLHKPFTLTLQ